MSRPSLSPLPIDELIPRLLAELSAHSAPFPALVLEAAPGAGKTTRVPWALLESRLAAGQIVVTEPRRVAAKMSATRVAEEQAETLGKLVGYSVRFDERLSAQTRLIYTTEGSLLRRLASDPLLLQVGAIVFDEIHERSQDLDLLLALAKRAALERDKLGQPPLLLLAMSATLDAERVAEFLGDAPRISSPGRNFPIEMEYLGADERPLEVQVRSAVRRSLELGLEGDLLVFLPGQAEIRRSEQALSQFEELEILPLFGELPLEAQVRVIRPGREGRRRVILATNVAETSLTIPGVRGVIDSGLARVARYDSNSLVRRLVTAEISQARLTQRAGRAGRTAPGRVMRLFSEHNARCRPAADLPDILRSNLSETLLFLAGLGLTPGELSWLDSPSEAQWQAARAELEFVSATDRGRLTPLGQRMMRYPVSLRLARMLVEAEEHGIAHIASLAAALLSEREILASGKSRDPGREAGPSDLLDRIERVEELEELGVTEANCRRLELSAASVRNVIMLRDQLLSVSRPPKRQVLSRKHELEALSRGLICAFWDRLAERRMQDRSMITALGVTADLDSTSVIHEGGLLLALVWDVPERGDPASRGWRRPIVRLAHRVSPDEVLDVLSAKVEAREEFSWNSEAARVDVTSGLYLGVLALDESKSRAQPGPEAARALVRALESKGPAVVDPSARVESLRVRLELLLQHCPETLGDDERARVSELVREPRNMFRQALEAAGAEVTSLDQILDLELDLAVTRYLSPELGQALRECCPAEIRLPSGRNLKIGYAEGKPPWIASRLQDFFSLRAGPCICRGRLPLSLHLLAPNQRPVQVTTDLEGFWERHYAGIRRELMRKYPRHAWPEDGRTAPPPTPGGPRGGTR
jgi:ATP-dependent helicase HrpB